MINFLKYRYYCLAGSILLMLTGIGAYIYNYQKTGSGFVYHIDFVGGTELNVAFDNPMDISNFRSQMSSNNWKNLSIQSIGNPDASGLYKEFIARVGDMDEGVETRFEKNLNEAFPNNKGKILGVSQVGSEVGKNIRFDALIAIILSLFVILLFIAVRSKFRFAVGAIVALAHDLPAVLVVFLLLREQISVSVLAAILAMLGYSINDTIVIFSRIKENMKKYGSSMSEMDITNLSINQTLRRTLLTSFATLLTVLSLLILGGETLYGFSLAMLVGIITGTYSSIYIASPVMLAIKPKTK